MLARAIATSTFRAVCTMFIEYAFLEAKESYHHQSNRLLAVNVKCNGVPEQST